jgi:acyl carrier protein
MGIEEIGADDNFFELGGHSLLATQMLARVKDRLGVELQLDVVFERPTVQALAEAVEAQEQTTGAKESESEGREYRF